MEGGAKDRTRKFLRKDDLILSISPQGQVGGCSRQTGMKTMRQVSTSKEIHMVWGHKVGVPLGEQ